MIDNFKKQQSNGNDVELRAVSSSTINNSGANHAANKSKHYQQRKQNDHRSSRQIFVPYMPKRINVYNFLRRPKNFHAIMYHVSLITLIIMALFCFALVTVPVSILRTQLDLTETMQPILIIIDSLICMFVIIETIAIFWSCSCQPKFQGVIGRLHFIRTFSGFFDCLILLIELSIVYINFYDFQYNIEYYDHISYRTFILRIGQWFHILRMGDRFKPWRMLTSVIWQQRYQFLITFYMCLVWLIFVTLIMFLAEKNSDKTDFTSLPKTFWWSIVSLFTIGYGDMTPVTNVGKILASIFFFIFIFKFALPAGILSTGLALKIQEQQRCRHITQRRLAAARYIKLSWRYYHYLRHNERNVAIITSRRQQSSVTVNQIIDHQHKTLHNLNAEQKQQNHNSSILNSPEIICIHFIIKLQYLLARRRFIRTMRPYDFGDIMEQYTIGHGEIIAQINHIHSSIDQIGGQMKILQQSIESINECLKSINRNDDNSNKN